MGGIPGSRGPARPLLIRLLMYGKTRMDPLAQNNRMRAARWSLAARLAVLGFTMLVLALASIALTFWVTWELQGGAAAVNEAGRMRMQAWRLALDAQKTPQVELAHRIEAFDQGIEVLRRGDPARPLFVPWNDQTREHFARVETLWDTLRDHWRLSPQGAPLEHVDEFVSAVDGFVAAIEQQLSRWTAILYAYQFAMMALAIGGAVALLYIGYIHVVDPVARQRRGLARIERGEFDARVDAVSRDEFGDLAEGFNRMAANLQALYANLEEKVREKTAGLESESRRLTALYDTAALLGGATALDELAAGFVGKVREIARADAAVVRWSDEANQRYLLLATDGVPDSFARDERCLTAGSCLCGDTRAGPGTRVVALRRLAPARLGHCAAAGYRTLVAVPVTLQQRVLGEIDLFYRHEHQPGEEDRSLLDALASQLANAMESMRAAALDVEAAVALERGLLAQELHDSIAQSLAFLKIQVRLLRDATTRADEAAIERAVAEIEAGVRESYGDVRELLVHFRTRTSDEDIEPALRTTLSKFEHQTGLHVNFAIEGHGLPLDPAVQVQALHIVQEALSNVRKHAQADQVWLRVQREPVWRFEVRDDGRGFDLDTVAGETQVGLRIAQERAERIGGEVVVESAPGQGTTVSLTIAPAPLPVQGSTQLVNVGSAAERPHAPESMPVADGSVVPMKFVRTVPGRADARPATPARPLSG